MYIYIYTCTHTCLYMYIYIYILYIHIFAVCEVLFSSTVTICIFEHLCVHMHIYIYIYIYTGVYIYRESEIYIHTYMYIYICIYIQHSIVPTKSIPGTHIILVIEKQSNTPFRKKQLDSVSLWYGPLYTVPVCARAHTSRIRMHKRCRFIWFLGKALH